MRHIIQRTFFALGFLFIIIAAWIVFSPQFAHAAACSGSCGGGGADGAVSAVTLLDADADGFPDRITLNIANPTGHTWALTGASPYGLSVTQGGMDITVTGASFTTATTANPVGLQINLDEGDAQLVQNSDGVNDNAIELAYDQETNDQTCTSCIRDTTNDEMDGLSSGDGTSALPTEIDGMIPVVTVAEVNTTTSGGMTYNSIELNYSERIFISLDGDGGTDLSRAGTTAAASTATAGAMTTARTIAGIGSWAAANGGDMTVSAATVNRLSLGTSGNSLTVIMNFTDSGYFSAGSTAPTTATFTPVGNAMIVRDAASLAVSTGTINLAVDTAWDVTVPTVANTYSCYSTSNGTVNRVQVNFSESINDNALATSVFEVDNDTTNNGTGEETPSSLNTATAGCDGAASDADANDEKMRVDLTTGIAGTELVNLHYASGASNFVRDWAGNRLADGSALGTENDRAAPLLTLSDPVHGATGLATNTDVDLTFSEAINTGTFAVTLSSYSSGITTTFSSGNTVANLVFAAALTSGTTYTLTIGTASDSSVNAFNGAITGITHPINFTVGTASSGGVNVPVTPPTSTTPEILIYDISDVIVEGSQVALTWKTSGSGIDTIRLDITFDNGMNYTDIADNIDVLETSYAWVPQISGSSASIRARAQDSGKAVLASDTTLTFAISGSGGSSAFTLGSGAWPEGEYQTCYAHGTLELEMDRWGHQWAPKSGYTGSSPYDLTSEDISAVECGWYIRGEHYSTVYFISPDGSMREPFWDESSFLTHAESWDQVVWVTDATLATLPFGNMVLPKAGVVLVKIQSEANVYATVEDGGGNIVLRLLQSEEDATSIFGADWADYVVDLSPTVFYMYEQGGYARTDEEWDVEKMKTREEVS